MIIAKQYCHMKCHGNVISVCNCIELYRKQLSVHAERSKQPIKSSPLIYLKPSKSYLFVKI